VPSTIDDNQAMIRELQSKTITKMFAQINQDRREAERRKTCYEQREREQKDQEVTKMKSIKVGEKIREWRNEWVTGETLVAREGVDNKRII
jgi:uncharacterized membrane protein YfhO